VHWFYEQAGMKDCQSAAFVSYGRIDSKAFAIKLCDRLTEKGLEIWLDQTDIPLGVDFQNQIDVGIEQSHNFVFIISPHSVNSPYCIKEIEQAVRLNKRIVPLLHVEQITQAVWQQRYPDKPLEAWIDYQAKGLHSSFPNMHPAIARINWVYFREGIDDFELALAGLLQIFERDRDYVCQHTHLLIEALEWEKQHKQPRYLLIGEARAEAEAWLLTQFEEEQPPCEPTDLHCEFISESIKNANNLMTSAFLCAADADQIAVKKIARSLRRQGFTLWTKETDIAMGDETEEAINQGIEEATNILVLLSPAAVESPSCRRELAYARLLNKRLIPLLISDAAIADIPNEIQGIQPLSCVIDQDEAAYNADIAKLIRALRQEAAYYEQRKILLSKALKWQRQKRNPSILLRGYNLEQAKAWLETARLRTQHPPTDLHEEFIAESAKLPPEASLDVFILYSWVDADFARKLNDGLQIQGKITWFDQELIAPDTDLQREGDVALRQEIHRGIEQAKNVLVLLSPSLARSPHCLEQIRYAQQLGKRIVPVLLREVSPEQFPPLLAGIPYTDFRRHGGDFFTNFGELTRTLDADPAYLQIHTQVLLKAIEWEREARDDAYLLRGKELKTAESWLQNTTGKEPAVTDLQWSYIRSSIEMPKRKLKPSTAALASLVAGGLVCLARWSGSLQGLELAAYDQLLRSRPTEAPDPRITIVGVDEVSIQMLNDRYEPGRGTIPDTALEELLRNLNQHQPQIIAFDFIRDYAAQARLAKQLKQSTNLVGICQIGVKDRNEEIVGLRSIPELPIERVGFANHVGDGNSYIRRQNLLQAPDDVCTTPESLSLVVTRRYLEALGKPYGSPLDDKGELTKTLQFGDRPVPSLWDGTAYSQVQLAGYHAMLNYRTPDGNPNKFATVLSLKNVLTNQFDPKLVRDRIILIGFTATTSTQADYWNTPYGGLPGIILHGQMVSQLVSATLDKRPLIWWLPNWGETVWIGLWAIGGGFIGWRLPRLLMLIGAIAAAVCLLYLICFLLLSLSGGWLPLIPALLALLAATSGVGFLTYQRRH
jgi:CHASE2 domain-containing sensor protein